MIGGEGHSWLHGCRQCSVARGKMESRDWLYPCMIRLHGTHLEILLNPSSIPDRSDLLWALP